MLQKNILAGVVTVVSAFSFSPSLFSFASISFSIHLVVGWVYRSAANVDADADDITIVITLNISWDCIRLLVEPAERMMASREDHHEKKDWHQLFVRPDTVGIAR